MSHTRDFEELVGLLAREAEAYRLLLSLSKGQRVIFENGGAAALMKIIARKQDAISRLKTLDEALCVYTSDWQATMSAFPEPARREVAALVNEISRLVADLLKSERTIEEVVAGAKDSAAERIRDVKGGLTAAKAYQAPAMAGAGRLIDREG